MTARRPLVASAALVAALAAGCTSEPEAPEAGATGAAAADAGCDVATPGWDGDTTHVPLAEAPPVDELYPQRPAFGGQHTPEWLPAGVYDAPVEERAAVHNLEHGAVAVWYASDLEQGQVAAIEGWAEDRNGAGLLDERTGAGLVVAPYDGDLDAPVAFRAWGVTADCEDFDIGFADLFVADHFGSAGVAPEGELGGDPSRVVGDGGGA